MTAGSGRLTVFIGAAPGVGKTCAMLRAARERVAEGLDVIAGSVETHGSAEGETLLRHISSAESVPPDGQPHALPVMEIDDILALKPALVLVDDLARINAPGSRHSRRYMDVEELLDAGISVYATVDLRNIESLSDLVAQITGIPSTETVPDRLFARADTVQLVDAPAEVLIKRIAQGRVSLADLPADAAERLSSRNTINSLRELAFRFTAHRLDLDLSACGADTDQPASVRPSAERVLACIGPSPFGTRVLRAAKRLSDSLRCDLVVVNVDVTGSAPGGLDQEYLENNIRLAEGLGAEFVQVGGNDVAEAILETAVERNATQLVLGRPLRHRFRELMRGSIVDRIISGSSGVEIHLVPGSREELPTRRARSREPLDRSMLAKYLVVLALITLVTVVGKAAWGLMDLTDVALLYLLPVLYAGAFVGVVPSIAAAVASLLAFDVLFVPPIYHITVEDIHYLISFVVFMLVAVSTGFLASKLRRKIIESGQAEARARALYELSKGLTVVSTVDEFGNELVGQVKRMFGIDTVLLLPESGSELKPVASSFPEDGASTGNTDASAAEWAFRHGQVSGAGTDTLPGAAATYYPLKTEDSVIGVIGFISGVGGPAFPFRQQEALLAIAGLATLALNKLLLALTTQQVRSLEASEKLWNALFNSVSHDLRTPLSSITGAVTTLTDESTEFTPEQRRSLLRNIENGSAQMNRLVGKLLDMARVESGSLRIESEWCDIQDIVGVALSGFSEVRETHEIKVLTEPDLPLIRADFNLVAQVLINLLDNAFKYSPEGSGIELTWRLDGEEVVATVGDRGPGISPEDRERVFDKFYRLGAVHHVTGTGLGLSICKGIVEAHGGWIRIENRPGGGSLFVFGLPAARLYPEMNEEDEGGGSDA